MNNKRKETRGGARPNAGRKSTGRHSRITVWQDADCLDTIRSKYTGKEIAAMLRNRLWAIYRMAKRRA